MITPEILKKIFQMKSIAVVGISPKPERPSHNIAIYLKENGYTIYPVNPGYKGIVGMTCYPNLLGIPFNVDIVCVFRKPVFVLPIAEESIQKESNILWLQDGVINDEAAKLVKEAGLLVVMDDCMMRQHRKLPRD